MENRLKERLTGAAIVVAIMVLLVPEMFRGQRTGAAADASSSSDGPPVRSYTIDLSNGPARTEPLPSSSGADAASPDTAQATPASAAAPTTAQASSGATVSEAPKSSDSSVAAAKGAGVVHAPAAAPPAAAPAPSTARLASVTPAAHSSPASPAAASGWSVQLGLFAKRDNAERLMQAALAKGLSVSISAPDAKGLFHVRAAGLTDRAAAQVLAERFRAQGFAATVAAP